MTKAHVSFFILIINPVPACAHWVETPGVRLSRCADERKLNPPRPSTTVFLRLVMCIKGQVQLNPTGCERRTRSLSSPGTADLHPRCVQCRWWLGTCAFPTGVLPLGGAQQPAVKVLLPELCEPHVSAVVFQREPGEVFVKPW